MGFKTLDDFLVNFWEKFFLAREANNLLCMLSTWWHGNIGNTEGFDGNLEVALASIKVGITAWSILKTRWSTPHKALEGRGFCNSV